MLNVPAKSNVMSITSAAMKGDIETLNRLIQERVKVDFQDTPGSSTALMTAANWGKVDCVEFLLRMGAQINMQDKV